MGNITSTRIRFSKLLKYQKFLVEKCNQPEIIETVILLVITTVHIYNCGCTNALYQLYIKTLTFFPFQSIVKIKILVLDRTSFKIASIKNIIKTKHKHLFVCLENVLVHKRSQC